MTQNTHESVARCARYAKHVADLCRAFNIRVHSVAHPQDAYAAQVAGPAYDHLPRAQRPNCIGIAPVQDEPSYAAALHEIGHILHPTGRVNDAEGSVTMRKLHQVATLRDMRLQLLEEQSAWEWAQANALEWTATMESTRRMTYGTYLRHARYLGLKGE